MHSSILGRASLIALISLTISVQAGTPLHGPFPAGTDQFKSNRLLAQLTVPADFFGAGSAPCTGSVRLERHLSSPLPGDADTQIFRSAAVRFSSAPSCIFTSIWYNELDLQSVGPVDVSACNAGGNGLWTLEMFAFNFSPSIGGDLQLCVDETGSPSSYNAVFEFFAFDIRFINVSNSSITKDSGIFGEMVISTGWSLLNEPGGVSSGPLVFPRGAFNMMLTTTRGPQPGLASNGYPARRAPIFADDFESGEISVWSAVVP